MSVGGPEPVVHESVSQLHDKNTSGYRIRVKIGGKQFAKDSTQEVLKVDSTTKQMWVKFRSIFTREKYEYIDAKDIHTHIHTETPPTDEAHKTLSIIALTQELNTTRDPGRVLAKYDKDTVEKVLDTIRGKIPAEEQEADLESLGSTGNHAADSASAVEMLQKAYHEGINFETGKQDMGLAADRIMNAENPLQALQHCSKDVLNAVAKHAYSAQRGHSLSKPTYDSTIISIEKNHCIAWLENQIKDGVDLKTGQKDLKQVGKHLLASTDPEETLKLYTTELKKEMLKNLKNHPDVQSMWRVGVPRDEQHETEAAYVKRLEETLDESDVNQVLTMVWQGGINMGTGKLEDYDRLTNSLSKQYKKDIEDVEKKVAEFKASRTGLMSLIGSSKSIEGLSKEIEALPAKNRI
jgi:hypothetical protein